MNRFWTDLASKERVLRWLGRAATFRRTLLGPARNRKPVRRVVHVSPAYFDDESYVGGGERWAMSLAKAMADKVNTTFLTFGGKRKTLMDGNLRTEIYPVEGNASESHQTLVNYGFLRELARADVVHCHQFRTVVASLALLVGKLAGVRTFVTDLGGSATRFAGDVDTTEFVDCFLHLSEYAAKILPAKNGRVVYGGVNEAFCHPRARSDQPRKQVLCVARLLPHKGINYLIEAMDADQPLELIGKAYRSDYFELLQSLSSGKQVRFTLDASDEGLMLLINDPSLQFYPLYMKTFMEHAAKSLSYSGWSYWKAWLAEPR